MASKFKFVPYDDPEGFGVKELAEEYFHAMGKILMSYPLEHLELTHVESDENPFDDDDPDGNHTFVPVVAVFDPEQGSF